MQPHFTFDTATGGTVEATRVGIEFDLCVRNAAGHPVATVRMGEVEFRGLYADAADALGEMDSEEAYDAGYDQGFNDGYSDAEEEAA